MFNWIAMKKKTKRYRPKCHCGNNSNNKTHQINIQTKHNRLTLIFDHIKLIWLFEAESEERWKNKIQFFFCYKTLLIFVCFFFFIYYFIESHVITGWCVCVFFVCHTFLIVLLTHRPFCSHCTIIDTFFFVHCSILLLLLFLLHPSSVVPTTQSVDFWNVHCVQFINKWKEKKKKFAVQCNAIKKNTQREADWKI